MKVSNTEQNDFHLKKKKKKKKKRKKKWSFSA